MFLRDFYYEVRAGIFGLLYWAPFAWRWRSWDYEYGLIALDHHLKALEKTIRKSGIHEDNEKIADEIVECLGILNRIVKDRYILESKSFEKAISAKQKDLKLLCKIIAEKMPAWWD